jgi:heat shock protein HslJ
MRSRRFAMGLILAFVCGRAWAQTEEHVVTVTGRLTHVMAIGAESTGWMIEFETETSINGKRMSSIEVASRKTKRLEVLENKRVTASGKLSHRHGVETGERTVLEITSIREVKDGSQQGSGSTGAFRLSGSEWLLEDLGGDGVLDQIQATLTIAEDGKAAGNGSCNRFFGAAEIHGDHIKFGPLGATRMACAEAAMNQETKYLEALGAAERFEWKNPYLLIYCKGLQPLRFTRISSQEPAPGSN